MTPFQKKVYQATKRIPRGRVTTYGEIARVVRSPHASRAVGSALNINPFPSTLLRASARTVPCHRVVRGSGAIGKYALGSKKKAAMLRSEGVKVREGRVDLKKFGYQFK